MTTPSSARACLTCFGRAVSNNEAACLVLCALATILLDLHAWQVPFSILTSRQ